VSAAARTHLGRTLKALKESSYSTSALRQGEAPALDLAVGECWFDLTAEVRSELGSAISALNRIGYSHPAGESGLREAYLGYLHRISFLPAELDVLVTAGGKEAMWLAVSLALEADRPERVLVPHPGWAPYEIWVRAGDSMPVWYDAAALASEPARFDALIRQMEVRPGAVILNYPNNPTGAAVTQGQMDELVACASNHGIRVISDEVYRSFSNARASATRAPAFDPARDMMIDSCSKWLGAAGFRVGFLASGPEILDTLTRFRATYASCTSLVGQVLAETLLQSSAAELWLDSIRGAVDAIRGEVAKELERLGVPVVSHGALYIWARTSGIQDSGWNGRAERAKVVDGVEFGAAGLIRICIARQGLDPQRAASAICAALGGDRGV
jgi:aspartate/methionine/tyrosine aminotransferase